MDGSSRIEQARRRLTVARFSIGATAAAGLLVFALAARVSHPGTAHGSRASTGSTASAETESESDDFGFGGGSISPSYGGAPTIQSGGS